MAKKATVPTTTIFPRLWIRRAIKRAGKAPKVLTTDKLGSYSSAVRSMPEQGIKHVNKIRITAPENTIRLERLHSTMRRWERPAGV